MILCLISLLALFVTTFFWCIGYGFAGFLAVLSLCYLVGLLTICITQRFEYKQNLKLVESTEIDNLDYKRAKINIIKYENSMWANLW